MIYGMSTACFFGKRYTEQSIDIMGRMGIKYIEVFLSGASEYRETFIRDLKKRISDNGIEVYSVHALSLQFEPQLFSRHERQKNDAMDVFKRVLHAGATLGARVYVFHGPADIKKARTLIIDYARAGKFVTEIAEIAKRYGLKFSYENVHWCWYGQPGFAGNLAPYVKTDNVYYTLDIKQAAQSGFRPEMYVEDMKERLVNVHLCDYIHDPDRGIVPKLPFKGEFDFGRLKHALRRIGYEGAMMLEVYGDDYPTYEALAENYEKVVRFFS